MKYFTFGMKKLRVTQNYNGTTSHKTHWYNSKNYADYPIDVAGKDGGKDVYYATVDMKVVAIKGIGNSMTNTIWLVATEKCITPSGNMTPFIALTHFADKDPYVSKLKVGSVVKAGQAICEEGADGATANHLHLVCGNADKGCGNGLIKNSNGAWVSNGYCLKPEKVFYIDKDFSKVASTKDINFIDKPKIEYYKKCSSKYVSIVDALKSIGVNSSFSNRSKIAKANSIKGYIGLGSQNKKMLDLLKQGKLIKY